MKTRMERLASRWPSLNLMQLLIIETVNQEQGLIMSDLSERLDLAMSHVQYECKHLAEGVRGRPGLHLLAIFPGTDRRTRQVFLAPRGEQLAELIRPLVEQPAPIWAVEDQPELFTQGRRS